MVREGTAAVNESGIEALFSGYMSLSVAQRHGEVAKRVRVRFPEPAGLALETVTAWTRHGVA
jgi:hypothetical protein